MQRASTVISKCGNSELKSAPTNYKMEKLLQSASKFKMLYLRVELLFLVATSIKVRNKE